jgi:hypothetical protein
MIVMCKDYIECGDFPSYFLINDGYSVKKGVFTWVSWVENRHGSCHAGSSYCRIKILIQRHRAHDFPITCPGRFVRLHPTYLVRSRWETCFKTWRRSVKRGIAAADAGGTPQSCSVDTDQPTPPLSFSCCSPLTRRP